MPLEASSQALPGYQADRQGGTEFKALAALDKDKPESQAVLADFYASVNRVDEAVKIYQDILA